MRRLHPDAPMPEVFADEPMLRNADNLRSKMSDEAFLSALGREDGWGDLSGSTAVVSHYDWLMRNAVPEPASLAITLLGLLAAGGASRRRKSAE